MVVQLTAARKFRNNISVPISCNPPPAVLLQFKLHESCGNNAQVRVEEPGRARRFLPLEVLIPEKKAVDPVGEVWSPPITAAVVNEDNLWEGIGDRRSDDDTISSEVAKRLEETCAIGLECVPFVEAV